MNEFVLPGCRLEPLGSYLKALGVLRLVAEQEDQAATGRWDGDEFVLGTELDEVGLVDFFMDRYRPTPLVAPWNGRSGFDPEDDRPASGQRLRAFEQSDESRCAAYREAIAAARAVVAELTEKGIGRDKEKATWVEACRAALPDAAVRWLDAVAVLTAAGDVAFPVVLGGAGGVLGSMDLSGNFLLHLGTVLRLEPRPLPRGTVEELLCFSLFRAGTPKLADASVGAFDPGASGADALVNPWDFVLLLEGALLFASAAARRLGSDPWAASPFMVAATAVGFGSRADGERGRGELWAPVWRRPASLVELERFIGEGRASWSGRQARDGLDFVRAAASLGVDRGVDEFVRHVFVERLGQSLIAVPVARVQARAATSVPLLAQLDRWLYAVRRAGPLSSIEAALRRVDDAQFTLAQHGGSAELVRAVLVRTAELEALIARSRLASTDKVTRPIGGLDGESWMSALDDGSAEYRLAAALVSQRDRWARGLPEDQRDHAAFGLYLRRVRLSDDGRSLEWAVDRSLVAEAVTSQPIVGTLAAFLARRAVDARRALAVDAAAAGDTVVVPQRGLRIAFQTRRAAALSDVVSLLDGSLDELALREFVYGLALLGRLPIDPPQEGPLLRVVPPAYAVLAPFFAGRAVCRWAADGSTAEVELRIDPLWPRLLASGRVSDVLVGALLRLRIAGFDPALRSPERVAAAVDPARLAAALAVPIAPRSAQACIDMTCPAGTTTQRSPHHEEAVAT